jgi:enoyl reductase-like protein
MYESSIAQHFAERGIQQGRILSVLERIEKRFTHGDADRIRPQLESIQDLDLLRQIFDQAIDAKTFDEFQHGLNVLISS